MTTLKRALRAVVKLLAHTDLHTTDEGFEVAVRACGYEFQALGDADKGRLRLILRPESDLDIEEGET